MKSSTHAGFEQDYNAQVAVDQKSLLIVGYALSNHPNDRKASRTHPLSHPSGHRYTRSGGDFPQAILAPQRWTRAPSAASSRTSQRAVIPIIPAGSSVLLHYLILHPRMQALR
jgi:hypothetical protein